MLFLSGDKQADESVQLFLRLLRLDDCTATTTIHAPDLRLLTETGHGPRAFLDASGAGTTSPSLARRVTYRDVPDGRGQRAQVSGWIAVLLYLRQVHGSGSAQPGARTRTSSLAKEIEALVALQSNNGPGSEVLRRIESWLADAAQLSTQDTARTDGVEGEATGRSDEGFLCSADVGVVDCAYYPIVRSAIAELDRRKEPDDRVVQEDAQQYSLVCRWIERVEEHFGPAGI